MTTPTSDIGPFSLVPRWVAHACSGQPLALALYVWLADHADRSYGGDGGYTIGRDEIGSALKVGRSTAGRAVEHLVKVGALTVAPQRNGVRQGWSRFHVHQLDPQRPATDLLGSQRPAGDPVQRPAGDPVIQEPLSRTPSCPPPVDGALLRFEKFWDLYPRKEGKKAALSAFKSMLKREHLGAAQRALLMHIAMWKQQNRDTSTIPLASSWLNGQRYFDELTPTALGFPVAVPGEKHRHAGRIMYDGANNRVEIQDDGSHKIIATSEQVTAELNAADWNDLA